MNNFLLWKRLVVFKIKSKLIYRTSSFLEMAGKLIEFLFRIMIWVALLGSGVRFDTTLKEMVTYLIITSIVVSLTASSAGDEIAVKIRDGSIATDLIKPVNLKTLLFFNDFGDNIFKTLIGFLPIGIIVVFGFGFLPPPSIVNFFAFLFVLVLGAALQFYYNYILGLFTFWFISNPFLRWHFKNVTQLFSGQLLPIWLYPVRLAKITVFLPFRYFSYEPIALYMGRSSLSSLPGTILIMSIWMIILYLIERILWYYAIRKLVIQGG